MARSNLKLIENAGLTECMESVTAHLASVRRSGPSRGGRSSGRQGWTELANALDVVSAAIASSRPELRQPETVSIAQFEQSECARLAAEANESRLAHLLEKAVATLSDAKEQLATANARAEAAETDLDTLRRILIGRR